MPRHTREHKEPHSAPMLFTRDGQHVFLENMYRGRAAFLLCAGPSLASHDLDKLRSRGVLTMAVNNAAAMFRPHLWCSVDDPGNFCDAIWRDPGILKFVPLSHLEKHFTVRDKADALIPSAERVGDMPAVFGFRRNEAFDADRWLYEKTFNWGNHADQVDALGHRGSRSVMYVALRLLFFLGIRRVYLLGCDFRMEIGKQNYAFSQERTAASVMGNNSTYSVLNSRLGQLLPRFEREGFDVRNCTPGSGLTVFPQLSFEAAVAQATADIPQAINTGGMYDRRQRERDARRQAAENQLCVESTAAGNRLHVARPETTLVLALDADNVHCLAHTWRTWQEFKPWVTQLPRVVVHTFDVSPESIPVAVRLGADMREVRSERRSLADSALALAAEQTTNRWLLMLDPSAVATRVAPWPAAEWFEGHAEEMAPVCVAARWGYTKPADLFSRLDSWGDSQACFLEYPPLNLPVPDGSDRVQHAAISPWCLFVRRDYVLWVRDLLQACPIDEEFHTLLWYVATRRKERIVRASMKDYGWDHSFAHSMQDVIARAREILPPHHAAQDADELPSSAGSPSMTACCVSDRAQPCGIDAASGAG